MKHYMLIINGKLNNLNDYITACRTNPYKGAKVKAHNENIVKACIYEQLGRLRIQGPVYNEIRRMVRNRMRSSSILINISSFGRKVIQDALVETHVLRNDGWTEITGFRDDFYIDRKNPRIEVEIEEVG